MACRIRRHLYNILASRGPRGPKPPRQIWCQVTQSITTDKYFRPTTQIGDDHTRALYWCYGAVERDCCGTVGRYYPRGTSLHVCLFGSCHYYPIQLYYYRLLGGVPTRRHHYSNTPNLISSCLLVHIVHNKTYSDARIAGICIPAFLL